MPIHVPGKRDRRGRMRNAGTRSAVFVLSLTAMVDMFTVLVVFLLQNYKVTGQTLTLKEDVNLPQASAVTELQPSNVVVIGSEFIELNEKRVASVAPVRESEDWLIIPLRDAVKKELILQRQKLETSLKSQVQNTIAGIDDSQRINAQNWNQITIQADEKLDLLSLKKVMYTLVEAGGGAINFAVIKKERPPQYMHLDGEEFTE
ncbi:MAG: biopolymer transporter ExbD [Bdellovibrionaceae bacterium]|nr:biopolymer transporter ExbD [Pseudobdellovibrionaceae bacterium]